MRNDNHDHDLRDQIGNAILGFFVIGAMSLIIATLVMWCMEAERAQF